MSTVASIDTIDDSLTLHVSNGFFDPGWFENKNTK